MINLRVHRFAVLTAIATFALLGLGGLVTSHGVGMAVPDWPNTYGYNMFFFPFSQWVGGIFYEHSHRLLASGVGLLTAILALWLHGRPARKVLRLAGAALLVLALLTLLVAPAHRADSFVLGATGLAAFATSWVWPRCAPSSPWLRRLGLLAFAAVVLQGVLGGLRVVLFKDQIGIFHAVLAQLFFALTCAIALFTSRWWQNAASEDRLRSHCSPADRSVRWFILLPTLLILGQLILGAGMRHQHAGLAIPDFPLAYGKLWPATDVGAIVHYNQQRLEVTALNPITAFQIELQMLHRSVAVLILLSVAFCAWILRRNHLFRRLAFAWLGLILSQILLGAATIWSNKAADLATAHVLFGALSLALGSIMSIISFQAFVRSGFEGSSSRSWVASAPFAPEPVPATGLK